MQCLLFWAFLACLVPVAQAETLTITLPSGTLDSIPGVAPTSPVADIVAGLVVSAIAAQIADVQVTRLIEAYRKLPAARRALAIKALLKIQTTTTQGLTIINNAVNAAP